MNDQVEQVINIALKNGIRLSYSSLYRKMGMRENIFMNDKVFLRSETYWRKYKSVYKINDQDIDFSALNGSKLPCKSGSGLDCYVLTYDYQSLLEKGEKIFKNILYELNVISNRNIRYGSESDEYRRETDFKEICIALALAEVRKEKVECIEKEIQQTEQEPIRKLII